MGRIYDRLINKVFQKKSTVELKRSKAETDELEQFKKPFITVSREPGSGGKPVAKRVAKLLGFEFYDKALINDLARSTRKRKVLISSIDESERTVMDDLVHGMFNPDYVSDIQYMRHLSSVIISAAIKGEVVILGRGANFITPFKAGLHVRIQAPYSVRVDRAVEFEGYDREEAIEVIKDVDTKRKKYISQYFNKDISNANYYDLIINTEDMSIKSAAEHVILALKNKFPEYAKRRKKVFSELLLKF